MGRRILHEPLLHFALLGTLIFVLGQYWGEGRKSDRERYRIVVTAEQISRIGDRYARQYGVPPTAEQLRFLTDRRLRDEILYREGLALGLDRDDEIIRRRIVQKVDFLRQDLAVAKAASESQLQMYYREHKDRYTTPERRSFAHVYFTPDRDGAPQAKARAMEVLKALHSQNTSRGPELGDVFPGRYDHSLLDRAQVSRLFGESELANALFKAPIGRWSGPYRSGFGWHLVYVNEEQPPELRPLADIRDQVQADYLAQERRRENSKAFAELARKYTIVRADRQH